MSYQINNDNKLLKLEKLSKIIAKKMGMSFSNKQLIDLNRVMDLVAKEAGFLDVETYIDFLLSTELTHKDILDLAEKVTVGETYFFREKKALEILEKEILPKIIKQQCYTKKQLKIWSVGCSTGEEPYTLAMILKKVLGNFDNWDITIFASDISLSSLKKAIAGFYSPWSFRAIEVADKKTFFNELNENQFEIISELKKFVKFEYLNLAQAIYPTHFNIANSFDIIFCRNVMIYLTLECQTKIIQHFYKVLKSSGWLIVSSTEARLLNKSQFIAVHFPETILHQKAVKNLEVSDLDKLEKETFFELDIEKSDQVGLEEEINEKSDQTYFKLAQKQADQGFLGQAQEYCEKAIIINKLEPDYHYLLATILIEKGDDSLAIESLKKVLYLEPDFMLAYFHLAKLAYKQPSLTQANKYLNKLLLLMGKCSPNDLIPNTLDLTVGRLTEIVKEMIKNINI